MLHGKWQKLDKGLVGRMPKVSDKVSEKKVKHSILLKVHTDVATVTTAWKPVKTQLRFSYVDNLI